MARELNKTNNKIVTEHLINKIQLGVISDRDIPNYNVKRTTDFWEQNKHLIIGMSVEELTKILRSTKEQKSLMKQYDSVVASMSWQERIDFLRLAKEDLIAAKNKKYNTTVFITNLMEISLKVLPIVLAAL